MKKIFPIVILMAFLAVPAIAANETADLYRRLYFETESLSQRLGFIEEIIALNDPSTAPILADALNELILMSKNVKDSRDREVYENLARLITAGLGSFKYGISAPAVYKILDETANPLLKAEIVIALGRMRSLQHVSRIAGLLGDINNEPTPDRETGEKIAYGCIVSLEKMRSPDGFIPVFYAIDGWYTKRVRERAELSLAAIMDDPTEQILKILEIDAPSRKLYAMRHELTSKAPKDSQILAMVASLKACHDLKPRDKIEGLTLTAIRKESMKALTALGAKTDAMVPYISITFDTFFKNSPDTTDMDEKLIALDALGICATDSAATVLKDLILLFDRQRQSDIYDDARDLLTKAALRNAGVSKNPIVRPALISVKANTKWAGGVTMAANEALKKFQ